MLRRSKRRLNNGNGTSTTGEEKEQKHVRFMDKEDEMADLSHNPDFYDGAEVGIIEKICFTNFMCHKKLEVSFGANVNFVIGRNGSGKSAILTGIIIGLGGKANMTNQGNSLKDFIKEGCSSCTVEVTLRNRGTDAYKHDNYGKSIIVERQLNADGESEYKIKSCKNKVISTKRDELVDILDHFNIQIDNPVSMLTQDNARSFSNISDPKYNYHFFFKATQLGQIEEKERLKITLAREKEVLSAEKKVLDEKYRNMQELEEMKERVIDLKKQLACALVNAKKSNNRSMALQYCENLIDEIEAIDERVNSEELLHGKVEEVRNKYFAVYQSYQKTKYHCASLQKMNDKAPHRLAYFLTASEFRLRKYFEMSLSQRGYTGQMKINHNEETLIIQGSRWNESYKYEYSSACLKPTEIKN